MSNHTPSVGSALLGVWARWCGLVGWGRTLAAEVAVRCGGRGVGLGSRPRARVIRALEGDLDCLVDDAAERRLTERSAEELLLTDAVLRWLRGGELPGRGAVEFLEERVAIFNRAPHEEEQELRQALRDALGELVRAQAEAIAAGRWSGRDVDAEAATERDRRRFGQRLDELRKARNMTIGELAVRSRMDVVGKADLRGSRSARTARSPCRGRRGSRRRIR